jgi:hypothetical protein
MSQDRYPASLLARRSDLQKTQLPLLFRVEPYLHSCCLATCWLNPLQYYSLSGRNSSETDNKFNWYFQKGITLMCYRKRRSAKYSTLIRLNKATNTLQSCKYTLYLLEEAIITELQQNMKSEIYLPCMFCLYSYDFKPNNCVSSIFHTAHESMIHTPAQQIFQIIDMFTFLKDNIRSVGCQNIWSLEIQKCVQSSCVWKSHQSSDFQMLRLRTITTLLYNIGWKVWRKISSGRTRTGTISKLGRAVISYWVSSAQPFLVSGRFGTHGHIFAPSKYIYVLRKRPPLRLEEGLIFLWLLWTEQKFAAGLRHPSKLTLTKHLLISSFIYLHICLFTF